MSNFNEISLMASGLAQSGNYPDKVAALLLLASDAKETETQAAHELGTRKQVGYLSVLAGLDRPEFRVWKRVASELRLRMAHVGNAIGEIEAGRLDVAIGRLVYRPEFEPPEEEITYNFPCFAFDGEHLSATDPPDAFIDCDCELWRGEHTCTVREHVELNEDISLDVLIKIYLKSDFYAVFRDVDGDPLDPVWVGEWSGGNNGDSCWPGIVYHTEPVHLPALLDALLIGIKIPITTALVGSG